jgi:hypothetical protein
MIPLLQASVRLLTSLEFVKVEVVRTPHGFVPKYLVFVPNLRKHACPPEGKERHNGRGGTKEDVGMKERMVPEPDSPQRAQQIRLKPTS